MMLVDATPAWFAATAQGPDVLVGTAYLPGTIWSESGIDLHISLGRRPSVREQIPGTRLPRQCPERHIFSDAFFCMALRSLAVSDGASAMHWWDDLAQYLMCQSVADRTGLWPLHNGLDHGAAGSFHSLAIDQAEKLGILEEYFAIQSGQRADFSAETRRRFSRSFRFRQLLTYERSRREASLSYAFDAAMSSVKCCGSMQSCPYARTTEVSMPQLSMPLREQLQSTTAINLFITQQR